MVEGVLELHGTRYLFRLADDGQHRYWAWEVDDCSCKSFCHKWKKVHGATAEVFNLDNPPATVSFIPSLSMFV